MTRLNVLFLVLLGFTISGYDTVFGASMGASDDQEGDSALSGTGFSDVLADISHEEHISRIAETQLKRICDYSSVPIENVSQEEYQRVLHELRAIVTNRVQEEGAILDVSQMEKTIENCFWLSCKAPRLGNMPIVLFNLLLKYGNLEKQDSCRYQLLHLAVFDRVPYFVKALLSRGVDTEVRDINTNTPLLQAAFDCNPHMVKALWFAGACIDVRNRFGASALWRAICSSDKGSKLSMVKLLFGLGITVFRREQDAIARKFSDFEFRRALKEHEDATVKGLSVYADANDIDLPVDLARLITTFVVSRLEER